MVFFQLPSDEKFTLVNFTYQKWIQTNTVWKMIFPAYTQKLRPDWRNTVSRSRSRKSENTRKQRKKNQSRNILKCLKNLQTCSSTRRFDLSNKLLLLFRDEYSLPKRLEILEPSENFEG